MMQEEWLKIMRAVWDTLGAVESGSVVAVRFDIENAMPSQQERELRPNDGMPKVFKLVVTTSR